MRLLLLSTSTLRISYCLWLHSMSVCLFCTPAVASAVTLSVSILLTVHWLAEILRLTAMDGRSIDLAAHQKGTFFSIGN